MLEAYRDEWKSFSQPYQEQFNEEVNVILGVSEDDKYVVDVVTGGTSNKILGFLIQDLTGDEDEMGFNQFMRGLGEISGKPMSKINLDDLVETLHESDEVALPEGNTIAFIYTEDGTVSTEITCLTIIHTSNKDAKLIFGEYIPPRISFREKIKSFFSHLFKKDV